MEERDALAGRFESHRAHLRTMAYRILDELGFPGTRGFAGAFIYEAVTRSSAGRPLYPGSSAGDRRSGRVSGRLRALERSLWPTCGAAP